MRVLVLFNDYLEAGGERQSVASEIRAIHSAGITVELFEVNNETLHAMNSINRARSVISSESVIEDLKQAISRFKPDVVHAENLFPLLGGSAILAIRDAGIPWIRTLRNYRKGCIAATFVREGKSCSLCSETKLALRGIEHGCYRGSRIHSVGAAVSRAIDASAERDYPPSSYVTVSDFVGRRISNDVVAGVPVNTIYNAISDPGDLGSTPVNERRFDFCFAGRMEHEKGVSIALALAGVSGYRSCFVGDGTMRDDVQRVADRSDGLTVYEGALSYEQTMQRLSEAKVVLVPSQWDEPFGRVAAEAMSVGSLPLVANRGGLPEVVCDTGYEAVVRSSAVEDWKLSTQQVLSLDVARMIQLSEAVKNIWRDRFSEAALVEQLAKAYSDACRDRSGQLEGRRPYE